MTNYQLPELRYDYGPGAAHLRQDHGAPPRQAPRGVRQGRQHGAREARRGAREGRLRQDRRAREGAGLPPLGPRPALALLAEPGAQGRRRADGRARRSDRQQDFGGFASFKRQLTDAATTIMGSGWAALVWEPVAGRLLTTQIYDHQSNLTQGGVPHPGARRLGARLLPPVRNRQDRASSRRSGTSGTGRTSPSASRRSSLSTSRWSA